MDWHLNNTPLHRSEEEQGLGGGVTSIGLLGLLDFSGRCMEAGAMVINLVVWLVTLKYVFIFLKDRKKIFKRRCLYSISAFYDSLQRKVIYKSTWAHGI